jgi:hypothetical protein
VPVPVPVPVSVPVPVPEPAAKRLRYGADDEPWVGGRGKRSCAAVHRP